MPRSKFNRPANSLENLLACFTKMLLSANPSQVYYQTDISRSMATLITDAYLSNGGGLQDLLVFRENFEKGLKKKYGVKLATGLSAFCPSNDPEKLHIKAGVPQFERVMSGLLDSWISQVGQRLGTIKIHRMAA